MTDAVAVKEEMTDAAAVVKEEVAAEREWLKRSALRS